MPKDALSRAARILESRLTRLSRISDERGETTRTFLSPAMRRANAQVAVWMKLAGLATSEDGGGNLVGQSLGAGRGPTLLMGSHLDTVRDAGRFDGPLGVLLPLAALGVLRARGVRLPFAVEVVGFSEEEGVRFSSAYLGSMAYAGRLSAKELAMKDAAGVSVAQCLKAAGLSRKAGAPAKRKASLIGYVEVHIEQGPVLELLGMPAGVVSAIAGQTRAKVCFTGRAGHAGTTPMGLRKDALAGAAEFILAAESIARAGRGLVATVGCASARPGAANVIPAAADLSLDVRHPADRKRRAAVSALRSAGRRIARGRGLGFSMEVTQENGAVACSRPLTSLLARSVRRIQGSSPVLASGAGHDGVILSSVAPVAMLFVRCRGGISHHPDEHVKTADLRAALAVLVDFLANLDPKSRR